MQSKIHVDQACAISFLHAYKYFLLKWKFNANNFIMEKAAMFVFLYDKPYAIHIFWKYKSVCTCKSYVPGIFQMFKFLFAHLRSFHTLFGHDTITYENYIFVKKKNFIFKIFFTGLKEHSYVYLLFPEEDISPNDIGPHKSFNIPGTVSQPSGGSHPTNRQTDGEVLGKLQELYNERWAQRIVSHSLHFIQSERIFV